MSHYTKLERANIIDPKAFIAAAKELGFHEIVENGIARGYQGATEKMDVVARHPGCKYDVGIKKNGKTFDLIADWWGVRQTVPDAENAFVRLTTKWTIIAQYRKLGFTPRITEKADKSLHIELSR